YNQDFSSNIFTRFYQQIGPGATDPAVRAKKSATPGSSRGDEALIRFGLAIFRRAPPHVACFFEGLSRLNLPLQDSGGKIRLKLYFDAECSRFHRFERRAIVGVEFRGKALRAFNRLPFLTLRIKEFSRL